MVAVTHADAQARYGVRGRGGVQRRFKRHASTRGKSVSTVQLGEENGFLRAGGETGTHAGAQARCGVRGRGEVQCRFTRHARTRSKGVCRGAGGPQRCQEIRRHSDVGAFVGGNFGEVVPSPLNNPEYPYRAPLALRMLYRLVLSFPTPVWSFWYVANSQRFECLGRSPRPPSTAANFLFRPENCVSRARSFTFEPPDPNPARSKFRSPANPPPARARPAGSSISAIPAAFGDVTCR